MYILDFYFVPDGEIQFTCRRIAINRWCTTPEGGLTQSGLEIMSLYIYTLCASFKLSRHHSKNCKKYIKNNLSIYKIGKQKTV